MKVVSACFLLLYLGCLECKIRGQGKRLIDTPSGCPEGSLLAHDGTCQVPFKLNVSFVPDVTVTREPAPLQIDTGIEEANGSTDASTENNRRHKKRRPHRHHKHFRSTTSVPVEPDRKHDQ